MGMRGIERHQVTLTCPTCKSTAACEVQFKCNLGKRGVRIGETLENFPRIPTPITLIERGVELACGHIHSVGLVFHKGKLLDAVCPASLPHTPYLPPGAYLSSGKNTERRGIDLTRHPC